MCFVPWPGDLLPPGQANPGGCYDTKVSSFSLFTAAVPSAHVVNGPTHHDGNPPFAWSQFPNDPHMGMPSVYDFDFVPMSSNYTL